MRNFHDRKQPSYFEGWYLKHQTDKAAISFIPAFHRNSRGEPSASLQIITDSFSRSITFPAEAFRASSSRFSVKLGNNSFTEKGISLDLDEPGLSISGRLHYSRFTPLSGDIMGPFSLLRSMQCSHGVLSLTHRIRGSLAINGKIMDLSDGTGYIEKDWGTSFPDSYLWTQCSWRDTTDNSLMVSLATIPFGPFSFTGCICSIWFGNREYRLATYRGVAIHMLSKREILLKQGRYRLRIRLPKQLPVSGQELKAPVSGNMHRVIRERLSCRMQFQFYHGSKLLFDHTSKAASCEAVR